MPSVVGTPSPPPLTTPTPPPLYTSSRNSWPEVTGLQSDMLFQPEGQESRAWPTSGREGRARAPLILEV